MSVNSWDNFWKNTKKENQMPCFGEQSLALEKTWHQIFSALHFDEGTVPKVLDIACGDGSLIYSFLKFNSPNSEFALYASDYSHSACQDVVQRDARIRSICNDSAQLPFNDEEFDFIMSQYGIEYSGLKAFSEAFRCLKNGGEFAAVIHVQNGSIYKECKANSDAVLDFINSGVLEQAKCVFATASNVQFGKALQSDFVAEDRKFSVCVNQCKSIFTRFGQHIAGGYLFRVFAELGQMFSQMQRFDTQEVLVWIEKTILEMNAYQQRMASMVESAQSESSLQQILSNTSYPYSLTPLYGVKHDQKNQVSDQIGWVLRLQK